MNTRGEKEKTSSRQKPRNPRADKGTSLTREPQNCVPTRRRGSGGGVWLETYQKREEKMSEKKKTPEEITGG